METQLILAAEAGRLDRVLAGQTALSRARLQDLIKTGHVTVSERIVSDPAAKIAVGTEIVLSVPDPVSAEPLGEDIPLAILYEDDEIVVIDKPAGLVVHPAPGHEGGTLVNALIAHCGASLSGIGGVRRPGIVHRLDKDTSGILVVAKTDLAHQALAAQFADHGQSLPLERAYLALIWGIPKTSQGIIDAPIARKTHDRERMAIIAGGRRAVTHYIVQRSFADERGQPLASLLECRLETGRTHQIRVHLAHLGHPVMGDPVYGAGFKTKAARLPSPAAEALRVLNRQALHAKLLQIEHPRTGAVLRFESKLPADFQTLANALKPL